MDVRFVLSGRVVEDHRDAWNGLHMYIYCSHAVDQRFHHSFSFGRARHKSAYCISLVVSALKRLDLISDVV